MKILWILFPFLLAGCGSGNTMVGNFPQWLGEFALFVLAGTINTVVYTWPVWSWGTIVWLLWKIYRELRTGIIARHLSRILTEFLHRKIAIAIFALFLSGCVSGKGLISVPQGTRKITTWGVGCLPVGGWCVPMIFYWSSSHGDDTDNYNPAKPPVVGPRLGGPLPEATKP